MMIKQEERRAGSSQTILEQPVPQRVLTEVPNSGQPGGRGRRSGHAAAGPQCNRNRPDVAAATETRPTPVARRPTVRYDRPAGYGPVLAYFPGVHRQLSGSAGCDPRPARQSAVMDNMHQPPGGDPQDNWPTQELGPTARPASEAAQSGQQPRAQPSGQPQAQPSGQQPRAQPSGQPQAQPSGQPWSQPAGQPWSQPAGPAWGQPQRAGGASGPQAQRDGGLPRGMLRGRPWRGRGLWWTARLGLVALLAGGGALAGANRASPPPAR